MDSPKPLIRIATCMPRQDYSLDAKLKWLDETLKKTPCDLFMTPQEWLGGHYVHCQKKQIPLHFDRSDVTKHVGALARKHGVHIAVGACCTSAGSGATEDYLYYNAQGILLGYHSKFALPAYDDVRANGAGDLWPETNFKKRATPIDLPDLRLKVGTVFCWEVFSQLLWPSYSIAGVNFVTHPIKFAPRGWLKNDVLDDGKKHIVGFGNAPKSQIWIDRLLMASRHQVFCPIGVSCNSWDLGEKMLALTGHVDEFRGGTKLFDVPSLGTQELVHTFEMLPEWYEGLDHHHSAGGFKAHVGTVEGFSEMGEFTMHGKIRRLEAHLAGGTTLMDCALQATKLNRQKRTSQERALGTKKQRIPRMGG